MESDESRRYGTEKLQINLREEDVLRHCTDNPGRTTMLRTNVQQKIKANPQLLFGEAYVSCIHNIVDCCTVCIGNQVDS